MPDLVPSKLVPLKWGFCFAGSEQGFCWALDQAIAAWQERNGKRPFCYVEIGLGYLDTFKAVAEYLDQWSIAAHLCGVDIPGFQLPHPLPRYEKVSMVFRLHGSQQFFANTYLPADFVFIDGCHGERCVTLDFLGAQSIAREGTVIAFHDTDPLCQGIHFQPHCRTGIAARSAVKALGLLDDLREGWRKIAETQGAGPNVGHGCLFVQKTA